MKKKTKIIIGSLAFLFITAAILGTVAYFSKTFTSDNNTATAATFDVDVVNSNGKTIADGQFDLGDKLYPGMEAKEVYSFQVNKNNTELPVEYRLDLTASGDLFPADNSTPIVLTLQNKDDGKWINIDYTVPFKPLEGAEDYRILVEWPHGNNDIAFQSKTGNVKLEVVATQVDLVEEPDPEPEGPPYYTGAIKFKATANGSTFETSNKEINFYTNNDGFRVIEVKMGDGEGTFENKVGNFTVTEELVNGTAYFRVVTDKEYYASKSQIWRSKVENLDTSQPGVVHFQATGKPYLSIESDALYNWITK